MHSIVNCPAAHSVKNKAARQVPLRWRGAAQRRGGQRLQESATSLSLRAQRSNPVNYAVAYATHHLHSEL